METNDENARQNTPTRHNPVKNTELVKLLRRWTAASVDASHSTQQAYTFRRAANGLASHEAPIACKEDAIKVKYVGDKLASLIGLFLAFKAREEFEPTRQVASLRHEEEGKWWSVRICGEMAWRSWGKRSCAGNRPGYDNWEFTKDAAVALRWASEKATKQLAKGYTHAPGSEASYKTALDDFARIPKSKKTAVNRAGVGAATAAAVGAAPLPLLALP